MPKLTATEELKVLRTENKRLKITVESQTETIAALREQLGQYREGVLNEIEKYIKLEKDFWRVCKVYDLISTAAVQGAGILIAEGISPHTTGTVTSSTHTNTADTYAKIAYINDACAKPAK